MIFIVIQVEAIVFAEAKLRSIRFTYKYCLMFYLTTKNGHFVGNWGKTLGNWGKKLLHMIIKKLCVLNHIDLKIKSVVYKYKIKTNYSINTRVHHR